MRVLISGFESFGGEFINPTHVLVDEVCAGRVSFPQGLVVDSVLLPVGFKTAFETLLVSVNKFKPDIVLALGQAGGRNAIELERVAVNLIDAEIPDNEGWQPRDQHIVPDGPAAYFSTLPLRAFYEALKEAEIPVRLSNSAGLYVCNFLFYRLQHQLARESEGALQIRSGFVHFPFLPEQTVSKPGVDSMPLATMKRALELMLAGFR